MQLYSLQGMIPTATRLIVVISIYFEYAALR